MTYILLILVIVLIALNVMKNKNRTVFTKKDVKTMKNHLNDRTPTSWTIADAIKLNIS